MLVYDLCLMIDLYTTEAPVGARQLLACIELGLFEGPEIFAILVKQGIITVFAVMVIFFNGCLQSNGINPCFFGQFF